MTASESIPANANKPASSLAGQVLERLQKRMDRRMNDKLNSGPKPPTFAKTDKMPYLPHWQAHRWVLTHALWPMVVQQAYTSYTGKHLGYITLILFYFVSMMLNGGREIEMMTKMGAKYGFLDGDKHARDAIPEYKALNILLSLLATVTFRPAMSALLSHHRGDTPLGALNWWMPVEIGVYAVVLDFWFYWYHRVMHANDSLWHFHRTHHLTKHPNPLLTLYADTEQEIFDIAVIPFMTWATMKMMGLPMGFYDWWLCHQYIVFTELWGHSGLRLLVTPPTTATPLLKFFDAELVTEDHDLHHRKGWKKSHNYGKQTRLWDRAFGTCHERYETLPENIDYSQAATLQWF